jgi:UDP-hydrolysing UDP-N-acetyl-D-glucosamine 2-epimerase
VPLKIGFFTGARSEYGLARKFLQHLQIDPDFNLLIFPNGMHLLKKFGFTLEEIIRDGFEVNTVIETYKEEGQEKIYDFNEALIKIHNVLKKIDLDAVFVVGDRLEAYAAALAAHFLKIPVIHSGGGTLTSGGVDNVYRFNISFLASIHLTDSQKHYERLLVIEGLNKEHIYLTGSMAVDAINEFKKNAVSIKEKFKNLNTNSFALMTFHSTTQITESIAEIMDASIKKIINLGYDVLITYPNNDDGHESIIKTIDQWRNHKKVFISTSLGANYYYAALNECTFVVGNSSSALIEAPYFNSPVLNIGNRQEGRAKDEGIIDIPAKVESVVSILEKGNIQGWPRTVCNEIYGNGNSIAKRKSAILRSLKLISY